MFSWQPSGGKLKLLFFILSFISTPLFSQQLYEKQLYPFDGLDIDYFGVRVAASDSFLFVSSIRYANTLGSSVYFYKFIDNDYQFVSKIFPNDPEEGALFGTSLLFQDNTLFVGAQNKKGNDYPYPVGALYVFEFENNIWVQKQKILPPEPYSFQSLFSLNLTKQNELLLVSASAADSYIENSGKVYLYEHRDSFYELKNEFVPFDAKEDQHYGAGLLLKDDLIIIGSLYDSTSSGIGSGSIYVYKKQDTSWNFIKKIIPPVNSINLAFGCELAINDEFVFVGTSDNYYYSNPGKVYIYKYSGSELTLDQIIKTGDEYHDDHFGIDLIAKGDSLLVSALFDTASNYYTGAAYLFEKEDSLWQRKRKIVPSNMEDAHLFGGSPLLQDDKIILGARETKHQGKFTGAVYIYTTKPLTNIDGALTIPDRFYLTQNYPNPFNSSTSFKVHLPQEGKISIKLFDITGQIIKIIPNKYYSSGIHNFILDFNNFSSGIYFYRVEYICNIPGKISHSFLTKKAVLIK